MIVYNIDSNLLAMKLNCEAQTQMTQLTVFNELSNELKKLVEENKQLKKESKMKINSLRKENKKYKETINKLKDIVKNKYTNGKVWWFDTEYAKTYGELCDMAGAGNTRTAVVLLSEIEDILKEVDEQNG